MDKIISADKLFLVLRDDINIPGACLARVKRHIDAAPAVDAVPVVHARWEIITDDYDCEMMCCSACKSEFYDGDNDTVDCLHNYCPNCGAIMDGKRREG